MSLLRLERAIYVLVVVGAEDGGGRGAPLVIGAPAKAQPANGGAVQNVAVEDVRRILAEDHGKTDAEVARQLSSLVLTERMSSASVQSLEQGLPGTRSRWALVALADASAFLDPALADEPNRPPADLNEQRRMMALTVDYVIKTLPKLPDFYATRTTVRFDGDVRLAKRAGETAQDGLSWRQLGIAHEGVTYRNGREVVNPREWESTPPRRKANT